MRTLVVVAACFFSADALRLDSLFDRRAIAKAIAAAPVAGLAQAASAARVSNAAMDGEKSAPWLSSSSSNSVLGFTKDAPKPTFKAFDASLDGKLGYQPAKLTDESGSMYKPTSITGSAGDAANLGSRKGGNIPSARLAGTWNDPAHPGCTRKVQLAGNKAFIKGADEDGKPWKAVGVISGNDVTIDFSGKGGPSDVQAIYIVGKGLTFPDGNVWTRTS